MPRIRFSGFFDYTIEPDPPPSNTNTVVPTTAEITMTSTVLGAGNALVSTDANAAGITPVASAVSSTLSSTTGESFSPTPLTADTIFSSATTDTLNVNDGANGGFVVIVPPSTGTFTKTIHKAGIGISKVFSKSRLGYVRLDNLSGQSLKIGNADLSLSKRHAFGVLCRFSTSYLTGYTGELMQVKSSQNGLSGNPYFSMGVGGASHADGALRKYLFAKREGYAASVSASVKEKSMIFNGVYGIYPDLFGSHGTARGDNIWLWLWVFGTGPTDQAIAMNMSHDGTGTRGKDGMLLMHAIHGCDSNMMSVSCRWDALPLYTTGTVAGINPENLSAIDFLVKAGSTGSTQIVDVARVVKVSTFPGYSQMAEMCAGWHPEALGLMSGDDFCHDFGSLPAGCTSTGSPTFNPAEDGPIATRYHGTTATDVVLSVVNQRIS